MSSHPQRVHAPEFEPEAKWLNSSPIRLGDLQGKFVLLDFWTFCCINCIHLQSDLKKLEERFPDELVVIGVHSPKFDNEKDEKSLIKAIERLDVRHPVISDNAHVIWDSYAVKAWPTLILVDPDGYIVREFQGEGHYELLDEMIGQLSTLFREAGRLNVATDPFGMVDRGEKRHPISFPGKILCQGDYLYIADSGHHRIVVAKQDGEVLEVIGCGTPTSKDGGFHSACFSNPQGMAMWGGRLLVADSGNHQIRCCDLEKRFVSTLAGSGRIRLPEPGWRIEPAPVADLSSPWDLCALENYLFIAMAGLHQIWLFDLPRDEVGPFAGSGIEDIQDGLLQQSALAQPSGLTTNGAHLFVADSEVSAIRAVPLDPRLPVTTLVGKGLFEFGDQDGEASESRFQHPLGVHFCGGFLYVADTYNHKVKRISPRDLVVETKVGSGEAALVDGKPGSLFEPGGIGSSAESLYIADTNNNAIRKVDLTTFQMETVTLTGL
jgi:thiol-disulfide isomerase/thioredoxin